MGTLRLGVVVIPLQRLLILLKIGTVWRWSPGKRTPLFLWLESAPSSPSSEGKNALGGGWKERESKEQGR